MGCSSFNTQNNHGIMGEEEEEEEEDVDSLSFSSDISSNSSVSSLLDFIEDATSSASSSPQSSASASASASVSSSASDHNPSGPLYEMSSLIQQLPFKRGLSKHYQGKSQSFTSLSNVSCLEDLVKPEKPYKKKLKSCKSYGGLAERQEESPPKTCFKTISKRASRSSFSSLNGKRNNTFGGNRPPIPPHKTSCFSNQTPFFA